MAKPNGKSQEQQSSLSVVYSRQFEATRQKQNATPITREVEFAVLANGAKIDLIRSLRQPSNLEFLVWQDGAIRRTSQIEYDGEVLVVPQIDPTVASALRLPTTARPCPDIEDLFMQIMNHINTYVDITSECSFLVTAFVLTTWFADRLSVAPYLSICGPLESGKTTLLRLLHCLCRRAIHSSLITSASLYRFTAKVRPTFLLDEDDFGKDRASRDLQRLLRGGNRQGSRILSNGKAFENFGPKVIASRLPQEDAALVSRNINVVMTPSGRDVHSLDLDAEEKLSDALQPMLQMFRFLHYATVSPSQYPGFQRFSPRLRDNARALGATMLGNEKLLERLARALESQVQSAQFDRFNEPEWVVMLALYSLYHITKSDCYVHALTDEVNHILRENGERLVYSPKKVGHILSKCLGFPTRRWGDGYRLELTIAIGRKIHSQSKAMGLNRADILNWVCVKSGIVGEPCSLCSEFGMMTDHEGRNLRTLNEVCGLESIPPDEPTPGG